MKSAFSGPLVVFGSRTPPAEAGSNNPDAGPSAFFGGLGYLDPRFGYNVTKKGWVGSGIAPYARCLGQAPAALGAANLAALANVVSGTAMTLAGASTGITVLGTGGLVVWPSGNTVPAAALVLDGNPTLVNYGAADSNGNYSNNAYAVGSMIARAVQITGVTSGAGGTFTVRGYDVYGYPMSETITAAAGAGTNNGKKAFKFVTSITPNFTDAHNYSVGTTDIFGLPMRTTKFHEVLLWWNNALITASTGWTVADTTSPATATTGDVRGTYAVQSASDGTKILASAIAPAQANIATAAGLFGVTQV